MAPGERFELSTYWLTASRAAIAPPRITRKLAIFGAEVNPVGAEVKLILRDGKSYRICFAVLIYDIKGVVAWNH